MAVAAAALLWLLWRRNSIDMGSDWTTWWGAPARMAFSFIMGLWLYRVRERAPKLRLGWVALRGCADPAQLLFAQHAAAPAMADRIQRLDERLGEPAATVAIPLEEVKGHSLGGLGSHPRQAAERFDQAGERRRVLHLEEPPILLRREASFPAAG